MSTAKKLNSQEARALLGEISGQVPGASTFASWIRTGIRGRKLVCSHWGGRLTFLESDVREYARHLLGGAPDSADSAVQEGGDV